MNDVICTWWLCVLYSLCMFSNSGSICCSCSRFYLQLLAKNSLRCRLLVSKPPWLNQLGRMAALMQNLKLKHNSWWFSNISNVACIVGTSIWTGFGWPRRHWANQLQLHRSFRWAVDIWWDCSGSRTRRHHRKARRRLPALDLSQRWILGLAWPDFFPSCPARRIPWRLPDKHTIWNNLQSKKNIYIIYYTYLNQF